MNPALRVAAVMAAGALAVPLIGEFEGFVPVGYRDPAGIATACFGHTGPEVTVGQRYTEQQCVDLLSQDVMVHGLRIDRCIRVALSPEERAAYTSFAFNVGTDLSGFCGSTLVAKLNAGDHAGACAQLSRWININKKPVAGLIRRRKAERSLCERGLAPTAKS